MFNCAYAFQGPTECIPPLVCIRAHAQQLDLPLFSRESWRELPPVSDYRRRWILSTVPRSERSRTVGRNPCKLPEVECYSEPPCTLLRSDDESSCTVFLGNHKSLSLTSRSILALPELHFGDSASLDGLLPPCISGQPSCSTRELACEVYRDLAPSCTFVVGQPDDHLGIMLHQRLHRLHCMNLY